MPEQDLLETRRAERDALLRRATALLQADRRIVAAWLIGSEGRGAADDLSDIDLWLVIDDAHLAAFTAERRECVARLGTPVLIGEAPGAGPAGGDFLLVLYASPAGALHVDWRWRPRSGAALPQHVRLLFDRVGLPEATTADDQTPEQRAAAASRAVIHFWAGSAIVVKAIVRRHGWQALSGLNALRWHLNTVRQLVGVTSLHPGADRPTDVPPVQIDEQFALLRALCQEMEALMPRIEEIGGNVPWDAVPEIYRFFDLAYGFMGEGNLKR